MSTSTLNDKSSLFTQFTLLQAVRNFFTQQGFQDVLPPPAVTNPGMETHIHPFQLRSVRKNTNIPYYLHTSPEFHMKELLSLGFEKIFTLNYCFRDEPSSPIHRFQFIMLEWYRGNANYLAIMDDVEELISSVTTELNRHNIPTSLDPSHKTVRVTIQELFQDILHFDILNFLERDELYNKIANDFKSIPLPHKTDDKYSWDDLYFLLFLNNIEPQLKNYPSILLYEFPYHLAALSTIKESDPRVCERFELYVQGVELCNCFNELRDPQEQRSRFAQQTAEKKQLYGYELPTPQVLYDALERQFPPSAGIALGIERLLGAITSIENPFYN
jgi:lysyl-tRNA synthetase class 2